MMVRGSNPEKVREWMGRLERFEESKQTVARFCQSEGVSQPSFYKWKKKLRGQVASASRSRKRFQPVHMATPMNAKPESTIHLGPDIQIKLGSDLRITESIVRQLLGSVDQNSTGAEAC